MLLRAGAESFLNSAPFVVFAGDLLLTAVLRRAGVLVDEFVGAREAEFAANQVFDVAIVGSQSLNACSERCVAGEQVLTFRFERFAMAAQGDQIARAERTRKQAYCEHGQD